MYAFWSSFVARPLVFLREGVRVERVCLPCPWSVAAGADASSAFVSRLFLFVLWRASVVVVCLCCCFALPRLSLLFVVGVRGGLCLFFRVLLSKKRVCSLRRPLSSMH